MFAMEWHYVCSGARQGGLRLQDLKSEKELLLHADTKGLLQLLTGEVCVWARDFLKCLVGGKTKTTIHRTGSIPTPHRVSICQLSENVEQKLIYLFIFLFIFIFIIIFMNLNFTINVEFGSVFIEWQWLARFLKKFEIVSLKMWCNW